MNAMAELPAPLTPSSGDLRNFPFTPIFRARLFGSSFHAHSSDSEWRAGVTLWLKSWDQVPAGSLPDDDIDLCRLAELGRDSKTWSEVKPGAMRGWIKCSDGRWYHPVVAEGVNEALERKKAQRLRTLKARIAALRKMLDEAQTAEAKASITRQIDILSQDLSQAEGTPVTGPSPELSQGEIGPVTGPVTESVTGSNRYRQGYRQGQGLDNLPVRENGLEGPEEVAGQFEAFWQAYPSRSPHPNPKKTARAKFRAAIRGGTDPAIIVAGADRYATYVRTERTDPKYIAQATTWLNQERWTEPYALMGNRANGPMRFEG
jgi:hypothetical protein